MAILISDRNGNAVSMDSNAVGSNQAGTTVIADENGLKFALAPGNKSLPVSFDTTLSAYCATGAFTPVATATDFVIIQGSASKTVRVKRIRVVGEGVASAQLMTMAAIRRTSAGVVGAAVLTALTTCPLDNTSAAKTAVISSVGTANYTTLGTSIGNVALTPIYSSATGVPSVEVNWEFGSLYQGVVLHGTTDFLNITNVGGAAGSDNLSLNVTVYWEEY